MSLTLISADFENHLEKEDLTIQDRTNKGKYKQ